MMNFLLEQLLKIKFDLAQKIFNKSAKKFEATDGNEDSK